MKNEMISKFFSEIIESLKENIQSIFQKIFILGFTLSTYSKSLFACKLQTFNNWITFNIFNTKCHFKKKQVLILTEIINISQKIFQELILIPRSP